MHRHDGAGRGGLALKIVNRWNESPVRLGALPCPIGQDACAGCAQTASGRIQPRALALSVKSLAT